MTLRIRSFILPLMIVATLSLSACKTAEEKAEDYYQSGLALLAEGDKDRALIEFRNVFKYNGFHKEARLTYADILLKDGKTQEAYSQYLRLIEQYPDTAEVRVTLAEIAIENGAWDEVERHGNAAIALTPDVPRVQAVKLVLDFRTAVLAKDLAAQAKLTEAARALLATQPESKITRRILIGSIAGGPDPKLALPVIEEGLALDPKALDFYMMKLRILAQANDAQGTGDVLKKMFELFPDNPEVTQSLIAWYMIQKDFDGAEAFLRKLAGPSDGPTDAHMAVVQFLQMARSPEAARAELVALTEANKGTDKADLYGGMLASTDFEAGKHEEGIAALQAIVKAASPSDQTRNLKAILAHMLDRTENRVGARALVEEILTEDKANIAALKQRGGWFIDDDKPSEAIVDLRAALDQAPRDTEALTLMAAAYERDGNLNLAGDQLAKAVEVSGAAAKESLRYAQFLMRLGRVEAVEGLLDNARKASPADPDLLRAQVRYFIGQRQWLQASSAAAAFEALGVPDSTAEIQQMQAAILAGQNRIDESLALLQTNIGDGASANAAVMTIVQTQVQAGKTAEARAYLDDVLAKSPQDKVLRMLSGNLDRVLGKTAEAEATYRALIAETPTDEGAVQQLYSLLQTSGRAADATAILEAGIAAQPESRTLAWLKAGELEAAGKIPEAIAVYEMLYAQTTSDTVVANNLASLISAHYDDEANLARAEAIARRLRGQEVPAFQDTYGWIAFRRGNLDEALSHLEPAAKGLPNDILTQFHLGMLYDKLNRGADAIRQLDLALSLAGEGSTLPQMAIARQTLDRLKAAAPAKTP